MSKSSGTPEHRPVEIDFTDLEPLLGQSFGPSRWLPIEQKLIDRFAAVTGDSAWYHVDVDRAREELPGKATIAHGYLTLALIPQLAQDLLRIRFKERALNYGADRLRFSAPVSAGDSVRLVLTPMDMVDHRRGTLLRVKNVLEGSVDGRPVLVLEHLLLALNERRGGDPGRGPREHRAACPRSAWRP